MSNYEYAYTKRDCRACWRFGAIIGFAAGYLIASAVATASFAHYWPVCP